jgi:hypothetical protein
MVNLRPVDNMERGEEVTSEDKKAISLRRKHLREENLKWPATLRLVPQHQWIGTQRPGEMPRMAVWRSRTFLVQGYQERDGIIRISVSRNELTRTGDWKAGITWDDLQRIKHEAGYGDRDAVEIYPCDEDIVDVANMRHLWILPDPCPFKWRGTNQR